MQVVIGSSTSRIVTSRVTATKTNSRVAAAVVVGISTRIGRVTVEDIKINIKVRYCTWYGGIS